MHLALEGFLLGLSLLTPIGPQNTFVLKNGLNRTFVVLTPLMTSLCDTVLILAGVFGCGQLLHEYKTVKLVLMVLGVVFLVLFSLKCFSNLFKKEKLKISGSSKMTSLKKVILYALGLTFLNPHAMLDTLVIIGSVATSYELTEALYFTFGLISSSFVWFFSLSFFASGFSKYLAKPIVWKFIDLAICIICLKIAYDLTQAIINGYHHL